ncbi:MAG: TRAP transporter small permease [Clostridiales Family XIII bacterium]|jgi:TRAP-type C4-dicarboxylate transport system permease small subunit|nr:TRAP transporter small permease [Clostridiales Family XIII bacterium]
MSVFLKTLKAITQALMYVSYGAIIVMMVMTVADVISRYVFNKPSSGVTEWSQMLLIICMTAMAHALVEGRYVAVGTIVDRFPRKVNITFEIVIGIVSFIFFFVVGYQLVKMIGMSKQFHETYFILGTPRWPLYLILGIAFLSTALATVVYVIERVTKYTDPKEKSVFDENPDLAILALSDEEKA